MSESSKDLKHMKRGDLVEIIYKYQQNEKALNEEISVLRKALEDRRIRIESAGNIAEASLSLSGIFETAQSAADVYIEELRLTAETKKLYLAKIRALAKKIAAENGTISSPVVPAAVSDAPLEDDHTEQASEVVYQEIEPAEPEKIEEEFEEAAEEHVPEVLEVFEIKEEPVSEYEEPEITSEEPEIDNFEAADFEAEEEKSDVVSAEEQYEAAPEEAVEHVSFEETYEEIVPAVFEEIVQEEAVDEEQFVPAYRGPVSFKRSRKPVAEPEPELEAEIEETSEFAVSPEEAGEYVMFGEPYEEPVYEENFEVFPETAGEYVTFEEEHEAPAEEEHHVSFFNEFAENVRSGSSADEFETEVEKFDVSFEEADRSEVFEDRFDDIVTVGIEETAYEAYDEFPKYDMPSLSEAEEFETEVPAALFDEEVKVAVIEEVHEEPAAIEDFAEIKHEMPNAEIANSQRKRSVPPTQRKKTTIAFPEPQRKKTIIAFPGSQRKKSSGSSAKNKAEKRG